jgi:uncharacterized protein (TIGR03437 family)
MKKLAFFAFICAHPRLMAVPLWFEPNQGQAHASVQFLSRSIYLGSGRAAIHTGGNKPLVMSLIGARRDIVPEGLEPLPGITSYFIGNDPNKWHGGVQHFAKVRYRDVYPGIDLIYHGNAEGRMEYDFVVAPEADPSGIQIAYNETVRVEANGDLMVAGVRQTRPKVYQNGREIGAAYRVQSKNRVQVALADYDHSQSLTVDPVLVYSTYLGGPAFEVGSGIQVDAKGNSYVSMLERSPATPSLNPFQQSSGSAYAAFVVKFAPNGQSILYYAYVGGSADSYVNSIAIDSSGNSYITGQTSANDFPLKNAPQTTYGGGFSDAFVAKISSDGRSILYSTYLGGAGNDVGNTISVDSSGRAYVGGYTNSKDFPTHNALQAQSMGASGFLTRLSADGKTFEYSTYYGGSGISSVNGVTFDVNDYIYIAGKAGAADFPLKNPFQSSAAGGFVAKLTPAGDSVVYSSFLGDPQTIAWGIAVDSSGAAFVSGNAGNQFATRNAFQASFGGGASDLFLAKVSPDGSGLVFATYFGGSDSEYQNQNELALDAAGNVYITGWTFSGDFPLENSLQSATAGGQSADAVVVEFSSSGSLVYSTVFGGNADNRGSAIAVNATGVYVTGSTRASDFPLKNPFQSTYGGGGDAVVFKLAPSVPTGSPLNISSSALQFSYVLGGSAPSTQTISVASSTAVDFTPTWTASWLKVSSTAQVTPATLTVSVDPTGLSPGQYSGKIQIDSLTSVQVNLTVLGPAPTVTSVLPASVPVGSDTTVLTISGSGFQQGAVVQLNGGAFSTTFVDSSTLQFTMDKSNLTQPATLPFTVVNPQSAPSNTVTFTIGTPVPVFTAAGVVNAANFAGGPVAPGEIVTIFGTNLSGSVTFDGTPATLVFASPTQVNVTVPYSVAGPTTALQMGASSVQLQVASSAPGIFAAASTGDGIVVLYATGCGSLTTDALPLCALPVLVTVNGEPAQVLYAGIAPGLVEGANQINFRLPADITTGQVSIILTAGDGSSKPFSFTLP